MPDRDRPPQTTKLLEDVLFDALQLPVDDRTVYVNQSYPDHPDQRRELKKLLAIAENDPALLVAPDDPDLPPVLGGYKIVGQCGRGGMGFVYEATDQSLDRRVALKILPEHLALNAKALTNFEREARVLASLVHTNIAVLHSKEHHENIHFLTMEFVPGRTLDDVLREGPLPVTVALDYFRQITTALAYAHAQGVVHLDLKPANIMVTDEGQIKLLDFGISRALQPAPVGLPEGFSPTDFTTPWGTPGYMSPEQLARDKVDFRTDFWALGCVLFEVLTGQRAGANPSQKTHGPVPGAVELPLKKLPKGTPKAVRTLIRDCTQTDPNLRPDNVSIVLGCLAAPSASSQRVRRIRAFHPLLLVIVLLGVYFWSILRTGELMSVEVLPDNQLRGTDANGQTVWTKEHPADLVNGRTWASIMVVHGAESPLGVVATTRPGKDAAAIYFLDSKTGSTRWSQDADWQYPINYSGPLRFRWASQIRWPGSANPVIMAGLRDGQWYSGGLLVLDLEQRELARYYHPGPLSFAGEVDEDNDGVPSYVFYGMNSSARFINELVPFDTDSHCVGVMLLDPDDLAGQAFPYSEDLPEERDWPGMDKAQERAYTLIAPVLIDGFALNITGFEHERLPSGAMSYQVMLNDGRTFFLDSGMRPLRYYAVIDSPIRKLPGWPDLAPARCLHIREGKQEYIDVIRTD